MGDKTHISWSDATWPVIRGCDKISPGCRGCWAIKDAHRMQSNPNPKIAAHFRGLTQIEGGKPNWSGVVRLDEAILEWPRKWKAPRNIFVASSGDIFHDSLRWSTIEEVFHVMRECPRHTYQLLTKRAGSALGFLQNWAFHHGGTLPHIQIGFSAENQKHFDERWAEMRKVAAQGWFVWCSYEPALGPINMRDALANGLRWVVCGGESGPGARPMPPAWARGCRDQCRSARVPFHFKQWGEYAPWHFEMKPIDSPVRVYVGYDGMVLKRGDNNGGLDFRDLAIMERVGKKKAGRLLDGVEWNGFPEVLANA